MIDLVLPILHNFAEALVAKLFVSVGADKLKSSLVSMRAENAKDRTVLRLLESLQPFFRAELTESEAHSIANALHTRFRDLALTPQLLAAHRFNLDSIADALVEQDVKSGEVLPEQLQHLLNDMTRQVLLVAVAISDILPEWERISWNENFRAFNDLQVKLALQADLLSKLIDQPASKIASFESEYRRYVIAEFQRVYVKGLGNVGDVKALSLDSLFIQVELRRSPVEPDLRAPQDAAHRAPEAPPTFSAKSQIETVDLISAVTASPKLVVLGAPGSGKSTLAQFIALRVALSEEINPSGQSSKLVPFLLRVRSFINFDQLPNQRDIIAICAPLLDSPDAYDFVVAVFRERRALVIIDGLDECGIDSGSASNSSARSLSERERVISWLEQVATTFPGNRILVTSRPVGYRKGELGGAGFTEYEVLPLSAQQQDAFIERWCQAVELSISPDDPAPALMRAGEVSADLKRRIATAKSVRALAYNPLMLSVICILHRYRGERLPERKVDLLSDCINVLLYDWRNAHGLRRSVIGDLDARELRALLEPLAWQMTLEGMEQIAEDSLRDIFATLLPEIRHSSARAVDIIAVIRDRTGVLTEVGPRTYTFMHLLFQEYLAAEECARRGDAYDVLLSNVENPRWKEIIPMAVAASRGNQEILIRGLLQIGAIGLAGSALAMIDRASVSLRSEFLSELDRCSIGLRNNFVSEELAAIVEIGTVDAARVVLRLILDLPVMTTVEFCSFAAGWDFRGYGVTSITELAKNTVQRALRWKDFDLGEAWGNTRDIGYYTDLPAVGRGASWSALTIGIQVPSAVPKGGGSKDGLPRLKDHVTMDPVYNYAVMLDVCEPHRGYLTISCWEALCLTLKENSTAIERLLLALHFTWYFSVAEERIDQLLDFLAAIPAEICPAFQVGILNSAMSHLIESSVSRVRERAEMLWRRAFVQIEAQICRLFTVWQADLRMSDDESSETATVEKLIEQFSASIHNSLTNEQIFPITPA
jgi:hypothetical protein